VNLHDKAQVLRKLHTSRNRLSSSTCGMARARASSSRSTFRPSRRPAPESPTSTVSGRQAISREKMLAHVAVIAGAVGVPVTADLEGGYGPTVEDAAATARGAIAAGAAGMNFEDSVGGDAPLLPLEAQAARIAAIRSAGDELGVPFVINARTDVYHLSGSDERASRNDRARKSVS